MLCDFAVAQPTQMSFASEQLDCPKTRAPSEVFAHLLTQVRSPAAMRPLSGGSVQYA